jgi:hypothetical protein
VKYALVIVVVAIIAALVWWRSGRSHETPAARHVPPTKVVKLRDSAERRTIAELITKAADARRRAAANPAPAAPATSAPSSSEPGAPPPLPGGVMNSPEDVLHQVGPALQQVTGFLEECAKRSPGVTGFTARLALTGDPDVGTLIDVDGSGMKGSDDEPLPPAFTDCVQDVLADLELPPMAVGDRYKLDFEFNFGDP